MCEGDLKFELLVFLAAPTAVLGLSLPFLLLKERKRNRLNNPLIPKTRVGSLTHTYVEKGLKLDSQTCMSSSPPPKDSMSSSSRRAAHPPKLF